MMNYKYIKFIFYNERFLLIIYVYINIHVNKYKNIFSIFYLKNKN